jgi:hypothetical protein
MPTTTYLMLRSARRARLEASTSAMQPFVLRHGGEWPGYALATPAVSPTLQVRLGLSAPQLLDDRLDLGRIAEQPNTSADPAASLEA